MQLCNEYSAYFGYLLETLIPSFLFYIYSEGVYNPDVFFEKTVIFFDILKIIVFYSTQFGFFGRKNLPDRQAIGEKNID